MIHTQPMPSGGIACAPVVGIAKSYGRVKQWELVEFAAQGSLANIYRARPAGSSGDRAAAYAVKMLRPEWEDDPRAVRLLQREALVGRSVAHPHLGPVLSSSVLDPPRLLAMPWLEGASLRARLDGGKLYEPAEALWVARQAAEALDALYTAGWLHGDVAPGNIFISPVGHATLIDLSFARPAEQPGSAVDRPVMGTCRYIAPELLTSTLRGDVRGDIYSLGAVLFEMLCGRVPYPAVDLAELASLHRQSSPPPLARLVPHVPREAVRLVMQMIANDPLRRPRTPRELIDRLAALEIALFSARPW
ncbi:MAG: serine/threonine protein kinase [Pirellulales bacterium]|nr:serine/threonine protein kinase [Pirellulales bacterium]